MHNKQYGHKHFWFPWLMFFITWFFFAKLFDSSVVFDIGWYFNTLGHAMFGILWMLSRFFLMHHTQYEPFIFKSPRALQQIANYLFWTAGILTVCLYFAHSQVDHSFKIVGVITICLCFIRYILLDFSWARWIVSKAITYPIATIIVVTFGWEFGEFLWDILGYPFLPELGKAQKGWIDTSIDIAAANTTALTVFYMLKSGWYKRKEIFPLFQYFGISIKESA